MLFFCCHNTELPVSELGIYSENCYNQSCPAAVERGFSVNKAVLDVNMQENSLIEIRDNMSSNNLKSHCREVPNPMIRAYTSARDK